MILPFLRSYPPNYWKWEKKQALFCVSNIDKSGSITLHLADFLLNNLKNFDDKGELNHQISISYDSVALLGNLIGDLSNQRRLTMKNALKPEYQVLCLSSTEIPHSPYLFGEDIGKQKSKHIISPCDLVLQFFLSTVSTHTQHSQDKSIKSSHY